MMASDTRYAILTTVAQTIFLRLVPRPEDEAGGTKDESDDEELHKWHLEYTIAYEWDGTVPRDNPTIDTVERFLRWINAKPLDDTRLKTINEKWVSDKRFAAPESSPTKCNVRKPPA